MEQILLLFLLKSGRWGDCPPIPNGSEGWGTSQEVEISNLHACIRQNFEHFFKHPRTKI